MTPVLPLTPKELEELRQSLRSKRIPALATWDEWYNYMNRLMLNIDGMQVVIEDAFNLIDEALGDTDPTNEDDPLLRAAQRLAPFCGDA